MTAKIHRERSTYRLLTPDELDDKDRSDTHGQFMGVPGSTKRVEDIGLENTPQYDPYEDETQNKQLEPTPKVEDHYIKAEILLP